MIYLFAIVVFFISTAVCFVVLPLKLIKEKQLKPIFKGPILGAVWGLWLWLCDWGFFLNFGGGYISDWIDAHIGIPAVPVLSVSFAIVGLLVGGLWSLRKSLKKDKNIKVPSNNNGQGENN